MLSQIDRFLDRQPLNQIKWEFAYTRQVVYSNRVADINFREDRLVLQSETQRFAEVETQTWRCSHAKIDAAIVFSATRVISRIWERAVFEALAGN